MTFGVWPRGPRRIELFDRPLARGIQRSVFGLGGITEADLLAAIAAAPAGLTEIMVHPAEESAELDPLRARYEWAHSYRFAGELEALCSPDVRAALLRAAA